MSSARIYLDNAATSWPKPPGVAEAVYRYLAEVGAPAGRSTYREAAEVERTVAETRNQLARLLNVRGNEVVFTANGTDSLNLAIHGMLRPGAHVITSVLEHNSVLRPLRTLEDQGAIEVTRLGTTDGRVVPQDVAEALRSNTQLVCLTHASNVTGAIQPIEEVSRALADHSTALLLDAAQTVGHLPMDAAALGAELIAFPAHKGLLGPLGLGALYVAPSVADRLRSVRQGGTGTASNRDVQPLTMPDKLESGNHNVPAIYGLAAALEWLEQTGLESIRQTELRHTVWLRQALQDLRGVTIYGPTSAEKSVGVISLNIGGFSPQDVASMLDASFSVQVRSGIHCAPLIHREMGSDELGGTVRLSPGPMTTDEQIALAIEAIQEISMAAV